MDLIRHEVRQGLRAIRKGRGISLAVVLILGIGIGVATTSFSFLDAAFLRPLPYPDADRLVALNEVQENRPAHGRISVDALNELRAEATFLSAVEGYERLPGVQISAPDTTFYTAGLIGTPGLLRIFDVQPLRGELPVSSEEGEPRVVLSHSLWMERFDAAPEVVGRTVQINGEPMPVAAVMPPGFGFPHSERVWVLSSEILAADGMEFLNGVGRLEAGLNFEDARTRLESLSLSPGSGTEAPHLELRQEVLERQGMGNLPWLLFWAGMLLLLLVLTNVAALLMVWHLRRRGERAVRAALGASPWQLGRQLLVESVVLALLGGALGLVLAWVGTAGLLQSLGGNPPDWLVLRLDGRVLTFTLVVSLGSVLVFGLAPAMRAMKSPLAEVLRASGRALTPGRSEHRRRRFLIGLQVAISTLLVAGSLLLVRTADRLGQVDPGHPADEVLEITFEFPETLRSSLPDLSSQMDLNIAQMVPIEGVRGVSFSGSFRQLRPGVVLDDPAGSAESRPFGVSPRVVDPAFFDVMGLELVDGRTFGTEDTSARPVVGVVPQAVAQRIWPDEPAVGNFLSLAEDGAVIEIIGVVADRNQILSGRRGIRVAAIEEVYLSAGQALFTDPRLLVRVQGLPAAILPEIEARLHQLESQQAVARARTLEEQFHMTTELSWNFGRLFLFLALAALLMCAIGLFGLVAQLVQERRREIGIRLAIGADPRQVVRAMAVQGLRITGTGAGAGIVLSLVATPLLGLFVYDMRIWDPLNLMILIVIVLGVGILASYLPARRAARVDATTVLLAE